MSEEVRWHDSVPHDFTPDRLHHVTPNAKITVMMNKLLGFLDLPKFKLEDSEYILKQGFKNKSKMREPMLDQTKALLEVFFAPRRLL